MTTYYKKIEIDIDHSVFDVTKLKGDKLFEYGNNIGYFHIPNEDYINHIFKHMFKIPPTSTRLVQAKFELIPHIDNGSCSCLNYYILPQNMVTNFWKPKENAKKIKQARVDIVTKKVEIIELSYKKEDLILVDSFTAKANEAYLLNIEEIHSVENIDKNNTDKLDYPRTLIQFQWDLKMDELIEKLGF
jgi:hypothetical protein